MYVRVRNVNISAITSDADQYIVHNVGEERPWRKKGCMYWIPSVHAYVFYCFGPYIRIKKFQDKARFSNMNERIMQPRGISLLKQATKTQRGSRGIAPLFL
jgi:hypothetical protein